MSQPSQPKDTRTGHTPGPWEVSLNPEWAWVVSYKNPRRHQEDVRVIADCATNGESVAECMANARLIAAAPEMLAALHAALEQTEDGLHQSPCDVPDCWVEVAERAVAKAEGRTS